MSALLSQSFFPVHVAHGLNDLHAYQRRKEAPYRNNVWSERKPCNYECEEIEGAQDQYGSPGREEGRNDGGQKIKYIQYPSELHNRGIEFIVDVMICYADNSGLHQQAIYLEGCKYDATEAQYPERCPKPCIGFDTE